VRKRLETTLLTDASRRVAWDILWRRLLASPPLLDDLASAIERAEAIPAPKTIGRSPHSAEASGRPEPTSNHAGAHQRTTPAPLPLASKDERRLTGTPTRGDAQTLGIDGRPACAHSIRAIPAWEGGDADDTP
jgi:hypothetical protein